MNHVKKTRGKDHCWKDTFHQSGSELLVSMITCNYTEYRSLTGCARERERERHTQSAQITYTRQLPGHQRLALEPVCLRRAPQTRPTKSSRVRSGLYYVMHYVLHSMCDAMLCYYILWNSIVQYSIVQYSILYCSILYCG